MWEWMFLKFDLPLRNYGTPHTAPCTMAKLMATRSPPPSTLASPPPALFLLAMDASAMQKILANMFKANNAAPVCLPCARLLVCSD